MAKRGTLTHRRTRRLAQLLEIPPPCAMGVMEALWHVTSSHAPAGDIGRLSDQDLADEMYWDGPADKLVGALFGAGVISSHPEHRLVVHGWSEHADSTLRHKLRRADKTFWDGSPPFGHAPTPTEHTRPATVHARSATERALTPTDADRPCTDADQACLDKNLPTYAEPTPTPTPSPAPAPEPTDTPPDPPAGAGGGGGTGERVYRVGDHLPSGQEVLEVDARGRQLVVAKSPPGGWTPGGINAAVARIVAAAAPLGYRFDRDARRRIRERLLGGEAEERIRAPYEAQSTALVELEMGDEPAVESRSAEPPGAIEAQELDQALRLAAPPARKVAGGGA